MSEKTIDLWPETINTSILSPIAILRMQAHLLEQKTKGIVRAEITVSEVAGQHEVTFSLVAPALEGYREKLLVMHVKKGAAYPVTVDAMCYSSEAGYEEENPKFSTQEAFTEFVAQIFRAEETVSSLQSIIAMSNEMEPDPSSNPL